MDRGQFSKYLLADDASDASMMLVVNSASRLVYERPNLLSLMLLHTSKTDLMLLHTSKTDLMLLNTSKTDLMLLHTSKTDLMLLNTSTLLHAQPTSPSYCSVDW